MQTPHVYIGGPYRYWDGDEGIAVRRLDGNYTREHILDTLPPCMLEVREVVAYSQAEARRMLGRGGE